MTEPTKSHDVWVGRATPRPPVDPYIEPVEPEYILPPPVPPGYILVQTPPQRRRSGFRVFLVVAGIFAACCAGGATLALLTSGAINNFGSPSTPVPEVAHQPTTPVQPAQPGLNTPVRDGKFEFVVSGVTCGQKSVGTIVKRKPQGQYCVIDLSVRNIGTDKQLMLDANQKAYGSDGTTYGADSAAGAIASNGVSLSVNVINPGATVVGKIVYDVPKDANIVKLELHDSTFSAGATVTI